MTLAEFKAWFEGFTEDLKGAPNAKQWERIQARVKEISGQSVSYPVYVDRYVRPYWERGVYCALPYNGVLGATASSVGSAQSLSAKASAALGQSTPAPDFNPIAAMTALGKADAKDLAA